MALNVHAFNIIDNLDQVSSQAGSLSNLPSLDSEKLTDIVKDIENASGSEDSHVEEAAPDPC